MLQLRADIKAVLFDYKRTLLTPQTFLLLEIIDRTAPIMPSTRAAASMAKSEPGATIENPIDLSCKSELLRQKGTHGKSFLALILTLLTERQTIR
jgi:hypothetical protein